jgi:glycerol-3-phosphate O-acyltransferase
MINQESNARLGKTFVIFGKSISLKEYITRENLAPLTALNINEAGLRLSERLIQKQQFASPISLNMVVATLILQEPTNTISLTTLLENCIKVYRYLKGRKANTFISLDPSLFAVQKIVERLGFKTRPGPQKTKGRSTDLEIILNYKQDQKKLLGLTYYNSQMLQILVLDSALAIIFSKHLESEQASQH